MFSEELEKYNWEEITDKIYSKTESDVAERSVRSGVAVSAHHSLAAQDNPLLRTHHVNYSVAGIAEREITDTVGGSVSRKGGHSLRRCRVLYRSVLMQSRGIVVACRECAFRTEHLHSLVLQCVESLGRSHLVNKVTVNVKHIGAIRYLHDHMAVPYLVKQRLSHNVRESWKLHSRRPRLKPSRYLCWPRIRNRCSPCSLSGYAPSRHHPCLW